jgi:hypothetical protein
MERRVDYENGLQAYSDSKNLPFSALGFNAVFDLKRVEYFLSNRF